MDLTVNWIAVVIAAVGGMVVGMVWYSTLAKPWMAAAGLTEDDVQQEPGIYIVAVICQAIMAYSMAALISHFGDPTIGNGIMSAVVIWIGFVVTTMSVNHRFQSKPWSLTFIDGGHWLAVLLVMGFIIGVMG